MDTVEWRCSECGTDRAYNATYRIIPDERGVDWTGWPCHTLTCQGRMQKVEVCGRRSPHQNVLLDLPADAEARKEIPICTGVLDYFPAALAEVARLSLAGNKQHNPGEPLHWARSKSTDQSDTIVRHLMQRGTRDTDGIRHSAKVAWRALALLQEEIEAESGFIPEREGGSDA